jgi:hypothetical protein
MRGPGAEDDPWQLQLTTRLRVPPNRSWNPKRSTAGNTSAGLSGIAEWTLKGQARGRR